MKYGILKENPLDEDEKCSTEKSASENKLEATPAKNVAVVKENEKVPEASTASAVTSSQLPVTSTKIYELETSSQLVESSTEVSHLETSSQLPLISTATTELETKCQLPENSTEAPNLETSSQLPLISTATSELETKCQLPGNVTTTSELKTRSQLQINEPVEKKIKLNPPLEKSENISGNWEVQGNSTPLHSIPVITHKTFTVGVTNFQQPQQECEDMSIDLTTNQVSVMEIVNPNDEDTSEVEMSSKPTTPSDVDMSDNQTAEHVDEQTAFFKPNVDYNFRNAPVIELSRYSWGTNEQKYLRGCVFSPDGTCILTAVNKDGMHVIELPLSLYEVESVTAARPLDILTTAVHVPEGGTVFDYCWYPFMNSTLPDTCCFISSRQHDPLQLWDAFDGKLRCTYRGYDAVDEVESALSVCFSIDGSQVIAGYKKTLKIFRTDVPGRDYISFAIKSPASCLAINQTDANLIAIGSWNSFVTFHDVRSPKLAITDKLVKHTGGITFMKFSSDGNRLITGARKDNKLFVWDTRNAKRPLFGLNREVETNQKIYFDLSSSDKWLVSGDTSGVFHAYDLRYGTESGKVLDYQYSFHRDCCNGVSLHPSRPIFATASGQHHFIGVEEGVALKSAKKQENSLIFWWCGCE